MNRMTWETDEEWNKRYLHFLRTGQHIPPPKREGRPDQPMAHMIEIRNPLGAVVDRVRVEEESDIPKALDQIRGRYLEVAQKQALSVTRRGIRSRVGAAHKLASYDQQAIYDRLKSVGFEPTLAWLLSHAPGDLIRLYEDIDPKFKADYRAVTEEVA